MWRSLSEATKYTVYGALFGLCFPVGAIVFLCVIGEARASGVTAAIASAHHNYLLYIIDTAPFFLGLFARFAGVRQDRLLLFSSALEKQVEQKTESLRLALSQAQQANETIAHMAEHDALTGLLNRRRFQKELERWAHYGLRYRHDAALIFIDLDKFKFVNDTYGHHAGDQYLAGVAALLTRSLRSTDLLARWGGDEFAVLLPETSNEAAAEVSTKLLRLTNQTTVEADGHALHASLSIGIALFPDHTADLNTLLMYADAAMYEAKKAGGNCWRMYAASEEEMRRVQEHVQWEGRIRRALENDQFVLFYQSVLDLHTGATPGYEILLRMEDRDGQLVAPGLFLESAERFGLSLPIDQMVIRKAARRIATLDGSPWVSLNLCRNSLLQDTLIEHITSVLHELGTAPDRLRFEIAEGIALEFAAATRALARNLSTLGCRLILDDFNLGHASLRYFDDIDIALVKIDGNLIRGIAHPSNRSTIKTLAAYAHDRGIRVAAKFVEDRAVLDQLRDLGVDMAQGFAIGRPVESIEAAFTRV